MAVTTKQIQHKVVTFAKKKIGQKVGGGECYDLANEALTNAGGKTASDYGKITLTSNYVWGDLVSTFAAQPGDILQFLNYKFKIITTTVVKVTHGKETVVEYGGSSTKTLSRPHHTAVVTKAGTKKLEILEQNVVRGTTGVKEKKVGPQTIQYTNEFTKKTTTKQVIVNSAWGTRVKKNFKQKDWPMIDSNTKYYASKSVTEKMTVTVKSEVTGMIKAYRPKPK